VNLTASLAFQPGLPAGLLALAALVAVLAVGLSWWRGLRGTPLRAVAALALLAALAGPAWRHETRERLNDIVLVLSDRSASQTLPGRAEATTRAEEAVVAQLKARPFTEVRQVTVGDAPGDGGTLAIAALARALAEEPATRVAGAILIGDGIVHDEAVLPALPAPLNVLLTGLRSDWDRRLVVTAAPAFGIIGETASIGLRIEEEGRLPAAERGRVVSLSIAVDGAAPVAYSVPVGADLELPLPLDHAGQNVVQVVLETAEGELTDRNNMVVLQVNGVRDRLRVLLVSGEPYAGERTWRNLLKSDSAVDLVHFTILRPPEKEDGVPVEELALIAFPTRELFVDKIEEFDLIIFDRYALRGILPSEYLDNIRDYVRGGGAVLVAAGPEFASVESLFYSGLGDVMPAAPSTRVREEAYLPTISELGTRHPVTEDLLARWQADQAGSAGAGQSWGRWLRYVELERPQGQVVMEGPQGAPLVVLNREGEGRVALVGSDQAWLWTRGHEGGGPQQELLRRLAHWLMKEPDLEEEALTAAVEGQEVTLGRRTLTPGPRAVTVTKPDGTDEVLGLREVRPGLSERTWTAPETGLYRLREGDLERVFAVGPPSPREFANVVAGEARLAPLVGPSNGGFLRLEDGVPDIRDVRAGRPAAGRGWIGLTPREAYRTVDLRLVPVLPDWGWLLIAAGLLVAAWLAEGQRATLGRPSSRRS
jgi:hypothetical protein